METKTCITCKLDKGIDQFALEGPNGQFRRNKCKSCVRRWNLLSQEEKNLIKENEKTLIQTRVEKICPSCKKLLSRPAFYPRKHTLDGMSPYCRACDDHRSSSWSRANYIAHLSSSAPTPTTLHCNKCGEDKLSNQFSLNRHHSTGHSSTCKHCVKLQWKARTTDAKRVQYLLQRIKSKCNKDDIPFNLELTDLKIPTVCPVLGIPLRFGKSDKGYTSNASESSPSVDRIDPKGGYVKGNVIVVSWRANRIKGNATVVELQQIAKFYTELLNQVVDPNPGLGDNRPN